MHHIKAMSALCNFPKIKLRFRGSVIFLLTKQLLTHWPLTQIAKFIGPTLGPPWFCRPQMGPMLSPWTLLSGLLDVTVILKLWSSNASYSKINWGTCCEIAVRWMPQNITDEKSTLVQVTVWCVMKQTITLTNVNPDPCSWMASLGHN